mgnify:CR=1 FL=1
MIFPERPRKFRLLFHYKKEKPPLSEIPFPISSVPLKSSDKSCFPPDTIQLLSRLLLKTESGCSPSVLYSEPDLTSFLLCLSSKELPVPHAADSGNFPVPYLCHLFLFSLPDINLPPCLTQYQRKRLELSLIHI